MVFGLSTDGRSQTLSPSTRSDDIVAVNFCDVLRDPRSFVGRTIKVNTIYSVGFEMGWLEYPPTCSIPNEKRSAFRDVWDKSFEERSQKKVIKKFNKLARERSKKNNYLGRVLGEFVILVRDFDKPNPYYTGYQYDFVVLSVVSAERPKK